MADRYWVGGTGTWNLTSTTNWAATDGGASGASVPTSTDNVFFTASSSSGVFTVTLSGTGYKTCQNFTASGLLGTMTLTGGAGTTSLACSGNWSTPASLFSISVVVLIDFTSTTGGSYTINTNGITSSNSFTFGLSATSTGTWTLSSALTAGLLTLASGTLTTAGFALTVSGIQKTSAGTGVLNLGSSTVSFPTTTAFNITVTGLTINAGTSTINCSSTGTVVFNLCDATTFYNVNFTSATSVAGGTSLSVNSATTITNVLVFNNLTISAPSVSGLKYISFYSGCNITVNGTLTISAGTDVLKRVQFGVSTIAAQQMTLTATTYNISNTDFRNCAVTGTVLTGTSIGDAGGNSNITFTTPKTVYWSLLTGGAITGNAYATSSGGTPAVANFPLAQDTLIFDDAGLNASTTVTFSTAFCLPGIDASTRTNAMTISFGTTTNNFHGDMNLPSSVSVSSSSGSTLFVTRGSSSTLNLNVTNSFGTAICAFAGYNSGTIKLLRNFTTQHAANFSTSHYKGTVDLNGFQMSVGYYTNVAGTGGTNTQVLAFGTGGTMLIRASQSSAFITNLANATWSYTGTGTIRGNTAAFTITNISDQSFPKIGLNGTATVTIANSCTIADVVVVTAGVACTLNLTSGITVTATNFTLTGSAGFLASIKASTPGSAATLSKASGVVSCNYLSIQDSIATGGATWYAGANSTSVSNNTGWIFTAPPAGLTVSSRISSSGVLFVNTTYSQFDEVTISPISGGLAQRVSSTNYQVADSFDEVTTIAVPSKLSSTGVLQVSGYIDEVTMT